MPALATIETNLLPTFTGKLFLVISSYSIALTTWGSAPAEVGVLRKFTISDVALVGYKLIRSDHRSYFISAQHMFATFDHTCYLLYLAGVYEVGQVASHASRTKTMLTSQCNLTLHRLQTNRAGLLRQRCPVDEPFHEKVQMLQIAICFDLLEIGSIILSH